MSGDELFDQAYRLNVVEEDHAAAIITCRKAVEIQPTNFRARIYLGMLLSDYGGEEESAEARKHFLDAITAVANADEFCDNWFEESGLHHLAAWHWKTETSPWRRFYLPWTFRYVTVRSPGRLY